jgi:hypothetical protein
MLEHDTAPNNVTEVRTGAPFAWRMVNSRSQPGDDAIWPGGSHRWTTEVAASRFTVSRSTAPVSGDRTLHADTGFYKLEASYLAPDVVASTHDAAAPLPEPSAVETAATDRVRLLARQYENSATPEDVARIEILTVRLQRLAPRTTEADIAQLEETARAIDDFQSRIHALSAEYGV